MQILTLEQLTEQCRNWQQTGERLVLTNGVFDLLHVGHLRYLSAARAAGERLIVAVNSDRVTRQLKGTSRPIVPAHERAELLAGLRCVDAVTVFDQLTAVDVLTAVRPAVYAKGGDYAAADGSVDERRLPEAVAARAVGARILLLPVSDGHATTALVERIRQGRAADD
jgi:D-glycero-beta-D-manno-heptose 1-phosphate adenylyltransferase